MREDPVAELEERIERELGGVDPEPTAEAEHLAGLERAVLEKAAELAQLGTDLADDRGHPVLADAAAWRDLAEESGAPEGCAAAEELARAIVEGHAAAWWSAAGGGLAEAGPDACFRALAEARDLDAEALARTRGIAPLREERRLLRERFRAALEADPPPVRTRDAWTRELLDGADVVLTSIDEIDPRRAWRLLALVESDLEWHERFVERRSSWRRGRLRRRLRRLRAEQQERHLQWRLERRFGLENVARFERLVLWLIVLVLALLAVETFLDLAPRTIFWLAVVDTCACGVFLWEVAVKLWMVKGKWRWSVRHFFIDVFPSIPFSLLLLHPTHWDAVRIGRAARFIRLSRLGRYARLLRPVLRLVRAFGFLARGIDRMVRRYDHLLNRDVVLYPTRAERLALRGAADGLGPRVRQLQQRVHERWEQLLVAAPPGAREAIVGTRVAALRAACDRGLLWHGATRRTAGATREIAAEDALRNLARLTPESLEADMGQDFVARLARAVRIFALPPIRWFPIVRKYVPRISRGMSDRRVVVEAAHKTAAELDRHHGRWLWFADLYGVITPAQFVDRVGAAMIKASFRPAYRLVLFALVVLVFRGIFRVTGVEFLDRIADGLFDFVGILGAICIAVLLTGWWLRRLAGQTTDFLQKSAKAQFLALTETVKGRFVERDAEILDERVLAPERLASGTDAGREEFLRSVRGWLLEPQPGDRSVVGRVVLLYREALDGALLTDSDTNTTGQLLGSLSLRDLRLSSSRFTRADEKRLAKLDLDAQKTFLGPYLWFTLVSQAIAHGVARLLVDYNRHALPEAQRPHASTLETTRFQTWLRAEQVAEAPEEAAHFVTTHFTALHFLDDDPRRDANVEAAFGPQVLARLRRDRRLLVRRVFGSYPLHKKPRDDRILNPYRFYQRWFAGGRALLLPLRFLRGGLRYAVRFFKWLDRCIREVQRPGLEIDIEAAEGADFSMALRKIRRMRGPVAEEVTRLRARFDPEYLGVRLPDTKTSGLERSNVDDDLRFLGAVPELEHEIAAERHRAERDLARFGRLVRDGLLDRVAATLGHLVGREHLRAASCAYFADVHRVRSLLSARAILDEVFERAARGELLPGRPLPRLRLYRRFRRYWAAHGPKDGDARRAAWRATAHNKDGVADALYALRDDGREEGERILTELLRHPERITEQLVTLRTVQTLALLDVLNYRRHVYRLGAYAAEGDPPGPPLGTRS